MPADRITYVPMPAMRVTPEATVDGRVELRAFVHDGRDGIRAQSVVIGYDEAWSLYMNLTSLLHSMQGDRMRNAVAGDCATCGNFRLITVDRNGHPERINCPDCRDRYNAAAPAYPAIPDEAI